MRKRNYFSRGEYAEHPRSATERERAKFYLSRTLNELFELNKANLSADLSVLCNLSATISLFNHYA
jgi:hypothetical protein